MPTENWVHPLNQMKMKTLPEEASTAQINVKVSVDLGLTKIKC